MLGNNLRQGIDLFIDREKFVAQSSKKVNQALELATEVHKLDKRKTTREPYVNHCMAVTGILRQWGADEDLQVAGLLHDAWEDHPEMISLEEIREKFGERVAHLVDGVSKFKSPTGKDNDFETLRKVARETLVEPGVAMVKMADRLHNMNTMEGFPLEKKLAKAKETLAVYVPMAESLGLWQVKNMLADISFSYTDPERYKYVKEKIDSDPRLNPEFIKKTEESIKKVLMEARVSAVVEHQIGGYWELLEKQKKFGMTSDSRPKEFGDITDVVSFRVVIKDGDSLDNCYRALGRVRTRYGGLLYKNWSDDYLVVPAVNGYSALHDTYKQNEGNIEVAFTTKKRERFNNWGVASISYEELMKDPDKYKRKMIFTPKEELVFLRLSARGIDVAYGLNPRLGLRAKEIKVNGEVMELDAVIPNAAMVEVVTDQHQTVPDASWLEFCGAETAVLIDIQMRMTEHDREVSRGEKMLTDGLLRERGILNITDLNEDVVDRLLLEMGCWNGVNDLYYKVAYGLDLSLIDRKLDEMNIVRGMYTSVLIEGQNSIGISEEVARIIRVNGGDTRNKVEWVGKEERFTIRVLLVVDKPGRMKIEEELREAFLGCVVI